MDMTQSMKHQVEGSIMQEKEWTRAFRRCNSWSTWARKSWRRNDRAGRNILVRGATSLCWPSPYGRGSQETPNISCVGPLSALSIRDKANILVEMREEVFVWPQWTYPFRMQGLGFSSKGGKIGWKRDSSSRRRKIKEEES
jgi:hypothetical protein